MRRMYLISWCDDNHDPIYWLNNEFLGVDIKTIAENLFGLGQANGPDSFPDEIWESLFDYFQTMPTLDEADVCLIVTEKWHTFHKKNCGNP